MCYSTADSSDTKSRDIKVTVRDNSTPVQRIYLASEQRKLENAASVVHIRAATCIALKTGFTTDFSDFSCAAQQLNASQSTHRFSFVNHTIKTVNMPKKYRESIAKRLVESRPRILNSTELVSIVRSRNMFTFSSDERAFNIESYFRKEKFKMKITRSDFKHRIVLWNFRHKSFKEFHVIIEAKKKYRPIRCHWLVKVALEEIMNGRRVRGRRRYQIDDINIYGSDERVFNIESYFRTELVVAGLGAFCFVSCGLFFVILLVH
ncbi:hypothetical protein ANN_09589, partial [Periplaneta americana]